MANQIITPPAYSKRLIWIWALGFIGLATLLGSVNLFRLVKLHYRGVSAKMTVKELDPDRRRLIKYSYSVAGIGYEGDGQDGFGNPVFEQIKPGDQLKGYYDSSDASISCLGEPDPQLLRESLSTFLFAAIVPSLIVFRANRRYKRWLKEQSEKNQEKEKT